MTEVTAAARARSLVGHVKDDKKNTTTTTQNESRELRLSHGGGRTTRHAKPTVFMGV